MIRARPNVPGPLVRWRTIVDADVTSVGNTFTAVNAVSSNGRLISIDNRAVPQIAIDASEPERPGTLPARNRVVFEVPQGADAAVIQHTIDRAAKANAVRPVVHLPHGSYAIAATLTIPPSDLQLVGDGTTVLRWTGEGRGPVIKLEGPSRVTLRELGIEPAGQADGLIADDVDQAGARVYLEGVQLRGGREANLVIDRTARAEIELVDIGHAYSRDGVSVKVLGGHAAIFSGASSGNRLSYEVAEGGGLLARDLWYEGDAPAGFARVQGRATFTLQGSRVASPAGGPVPAVSIVDLDGRVAILTTHIDDRIAVEGKGSRAEVLALGALREFHESAFFSNSATPAASTLVASSRQRTKSQGRFSRGTAPIRDTASLDADFVRRLLRAARGRVTPSALVPSPDGATDIRLFRVWVEGGRTNMRFAGVPRAQAQLR
jgi:hypothetical protein